MLLSQNFIILVFSSGHASVCQCFFLKCCALDMIQCLTCDLNNAEDTITTDSLHLDTIILLRQPRTAFFFLQLHEHWFIIIYCWSCSLHILLLSVISLFLCKAWNYINLGPICFALPYLDSMWFQKSNKLLPCTSKPHPLDWDIVWVWQNRSG